jgi:hypothetical protein
MATNWRKGSVGWPLLRNPRKIEYGATHPVTPERAHADQVADELTPYESALRKLPLPYSLALRLRDAGVAAEVVSEYVGVEEQALDGVYRIAEAKLSAAEGCSQSPV